MDHLLKPPARGPPRLSAQGGGVGRALRRGARDTADDRCKSELAEFSLLCTVMQATGCAWVAAAGPHHMRTVESRCGSRSQLVATIPAIAQAQFPEPTIATLRGACGTSGSIAACGEGSFQCPWRRQPAPPRP